MGDLDSTSIDKVGGAYEAARTRILSRLRPSPRKSLEGLLPHKASIYGMLPVDSSVAVSGPTGSLTLREVDWGVNASRSSSGARQRRSEPEQGDEEPRDEEEQQEDREKQVTQYPGLNMLDEPARCFTAGC